MTTTKGVRLGDKQLALLNRLRRETGRSISELVRDGIELRWTQHLREQAERRALKESSRSTPPEHDAAA